MLQEVFITCAVTGAGDTAGKHPDLPVTPEQIAQASVDAAKAGAAIAHVPVRDPDTGAGARAPELFAETVDRIRSADTDVVLNLTTGMGGDFYWNPDDPYKAGPGSDLAHAAERVQHVLQLKPEICSFDIATMNFFDSAFISTPDLLVEMGELIKSVGTKPELECFDLGQVRLANHLIDQGVIDSPALFQICLGVPWGAPADTESMLAMRNLLPADAIWSGFGISREQMPMVAQAAILGGNARVGLEDNLYLDRGQLASNAQLVERAVEILERMGARVLGPEQVRERLSLRNGPS